MREDKSPAGRPISLYHWENFITCSHFFIDFYANLLTFTSALNVLMVKLHRFYLLSKICSCASEVNGVPNLNRSAKLNHGNAYFFVEVSNFSYWFFFSHIKNSFPTFYAWKLIALWFFLSFSMSSINLSNSILGSDS